MSRISYDLDDFLIEVESNLNDNISPNDAAKLCKLVRLYEKHWRECLPIIKSKRARIQSLNITLAIQENILKPYGGIDD